MTKTTAQQVEAISYIGDPQTAIDAAFEMLDSGVELTWQQEQSLNATIDQAQACRDNDTRTLENVFGIYRS